MEIYLGILGCFPQAMHILNVINWTNIPFINSGEYYSIIRLACKEKKKIVSSENRLFVTAADHYRMLLERVFQPLRFSVFLYLNHT